MIFSSRYRLRFISGPPWGQTTRKSHIAHGSDYGETVTASGRQRRSAVTLGARRTSSPRLSPRLRGGRRQESARAVGHASSKRLVPDTTSIQEEISYRRCDPSPTQVRPTLANPVELLCGK